MCCVIQDVLSKTKSSKKKTIASWTETNHDAMEISRAFFKFTDIQSLVEQANSAIYRARVDVENARQSSHWEAIEDNLG